jgi:chromosome segregation ATPase
MENQRRNEKRRIIQEVEERIERVSSEIETLQQDLNFYRRILTELQHLTMAEKLLIQRVSPLIPVIHIKNGILGSRGHVVSFFSGYNRYLF